jgi:hypothetical protein
MPRPEAAPREEYRRRAARHREQAADAARREETISQARLGVALVAALIAGLAYGAGWLSPWWLAAPVAAFAALLVLHARVRRRRRRAERGAAFYQRGLARLDGHWAGAGRSGARFIDAKHPYADDLDLFGEGSLYELLCAARTSMGEETLAAWLLAPSDVDSVRARQAAVQALTPRLDLREDLAALGEEVAATVRRESLTALAAPTARAHDTRLRLGAAAVTAATLAAIAAWAVGWAPLLMPFAALAFQAVVGWRLGPRLREADRAVAGHGPDLELLAAVLERFEQEPLGTPQLARLRSATDHGGARPSRAVRRLRFLVDLLDSRRNQFFAPVALLTLWGAHCALAI